MATTPTGLTKSAGWEMGVRKTFPISVNDTWSFLFSDEGLRIWLGTVKELKWEKGEEYKTGNGISGVIRVVNPLSHIRITWKKKEWDHFSTLQLRTIKGKDKTTISFHHDRLKNSAEREEMLIHWENVLKSIEKKLIKQ